MNKIILYLVFLSGSLCTYAQNKFPRSSKEDEENVMSQAYWDIWNPKIQMQIDKDIEKNRKANGEFTLEDAALGSEVKIEQLSHDFKFGANIFNYNQLGKKEYNDRYKALYGTLFNSATVSFYWSQFEMQHGNLRFCEDYWDTEEFWNTISEPTKQPHWRRPPTDPVIDFCKSRGVRVHGHPLIWAARNMNNPGWILRTCMTTEEKAKMDKLVNTYPDPDNPFSSIEYGEEFKKMTPDQLTEMFPAFLVKLRELFAKRIVELAQYYGDRVDSWDVVNESATPYQKGWLVNGSEICKTSYILPGDYAYEAFRTAQDNFPSNVLLNINDYNLEKCYADQVEDLIKRGCKVDIVGVQMHLFNPQQTLDIVAGKEIQTPTEIRRWYDRLTVNKRPIHLSEITITAPDETEKGQKMQAIIAQNLYRLWFSLEDMMGITWWNVVDNCGASGELLLSGLFTREMVEKPVYYVLRNLINNEWKTYLTSRVQKDGRVRFRGFRGNYRITWIDNNGNVQSKEYYLK